MKYEEKIIDAQIFDCCVDCVVRLSHLFVSSGNSVCNSPDLLMWY